MGTTPGPGLKPATTYQEQVSLLRSRGLVIPDDEFAVDVLRNVNYYRFSAYLLPFRLAGIERYAAGTSFERIHAIYEFDRRLRSLLMSAIEPVEVMLRTRISYYHAHKYGPAGYENASNFANPNLHQVLTSELHDAVNRNRRTQLVKHHLDHYGGRFPIWVAVELFSLGMLSKFYANLRPVDRKQIARELGLGPEHLRSWLVCLAYLRNSCAHYSRLYDQTMTSLPRLPRGGLMSVTGKVFDVIYIMKYLYPSHVTWNGSVVVPLQALVTEYEDALDLACIGFPDDWYELLCQPTQ